MGYIVFILCYCFTILTESRRKEAHWTAIYVTLYVLTHFSDKIREILFIDSNGLKSRFQIHFYNVWNIVDMFAICTFLIGFILRWVVHFEIGRAFLIVSIVFFLVHLFDIFQANSELATYIMILQKMGKVMASFMVILGCVVGTYGIVLQATRFPYRQPSWSILKDIWVEPYFNLYGEVYHEFIDTGICSDNKYSTDDAMPPCWCCGWIGTLFQSIYMIVANILMLNLLVAVFNSVYEKVNQMSQSLIRFQRYRFIVDYQLKPVLPPPFISLIHIYMVVRAVIRKIKGRNAIVRDPGLLKIILDKDDLSQVHDFENQARDELLEHQRSDPKVSSEEQMKEKLDALQSTVEQLNQQQTDLMRKLRHFQTSDSTSTVSEPNTSAAINANRDSIGQNSYEHSEAEESASRALAPRLYRSIRMVSINEDDSEVSEAAKVVMNDHAHDLIHEDEHETDEK